MNKENLQMIDEFETGLRRFFEEKKGLYPEKLYSAMEYSVFGGGKRIRPLIMRLSAEFLGISWTKVADFAIAIELIHTYSLIHDDLPSMDNDDFRRGRPSTHKVYGEAIAILAGDALLNLAYEVALKAVSFDNKLFSSAILLAECAGAKGMVGGQVEDLTLQRDASPEQMLSMYAKKTAALIKAAALIPCYLHKNEAVYNDMAVFGEKLGIIFQLTDDMLDADKKSYSSYFGKNQAEKTVNSLFKEIEEIFSKYGNEAKNLIELTKSVVFRQK